MLDPDFLFRTRITLKNLLIKCIFKRAYIFVLNINNYKISVFHPVERYVINSCTFGQIFGLFSKLLSVRIWDKKGGLTGRKSGASLLSFKYIFVMETRLDFFQNISEMFHCRYCIMHRQYISNIRHLDCEVPGGVQKSRETAHLYFLLEVVFSNSYNKIVFLMHFA